MLQLFITAGNATQDYTRYLDPKSLNIQEQVTVPSQMTFSLTGYSSQFQVPPQRAYVQLLSSNFQKSVFTGFVSAEPQRVFLDKLAVARFSQLGTENIIPGGQLLQYNFTCTSDEYLLNCKAVPFVPAFVNRSQGQILSDLANILCGAQVLQGQVNTAGNVVTLIPGSGDAFTQAMAGGLVQINGREYAIATVASNGLSLNLTTSAGSQTTVGYIYTTVPAFFDTTTYCASGDIVPFFQYNPQQSWSELAKQFADGSRYYYKMRDKTLYYQPYGDLPLGIQYDETQSQATFNTKPLQTTVLSVPIVNDVTIVGDIEAGNNREDYFIGDGFTGNFPLQHKVFRGYSTMLLQDAWTEPQLNNQQWFLNDPNLNFNVGAGSLNIITPTGSAYSTVGLDYLSMQNGLELSGALDLEVGEVIFFDYCDGFLGAVHTDDNFTATSMLAAFQVSCSGGVNLVPPPITETGAGSLGIVSASGVCIQPWWAASGGLGPVVVTQGNHNYVLQMLITAPQYVRYNAIYRTLEGEEYGGGTSDAIGNVTWTVQDYDIAAATGFFYQPVVTKYSLNNVTLPSFGAYALANNIQLNCSITNTTIAQMPLGTLACLEGPSGLFTPTGSILPMLPANSGEYGHTTQFVGTVQPWASAASADIISNGNYESGPILLPPGALSQIPVNETMGFGFSLQAAQITQGNDSDTLAFYGQTLPAAGTPIRFQSWEAQAATSRMQDPTSIATEAIVVGDDGIRSAIVTNLQPLPRTSEDCDQAAVAYLADRVHTYYNGTYTCTSAGPVCPLSNVQFFTPLASDPIFWPTCGRFFNVNTPSRDISNQYFLVTQLQVTILDLSTELMQFQIQFGPDLHLEKVLNNFVDLNPPQVLFPTDTANPPNPRFIQNVNDTYLPDLSNVHIDQTSITDTSINVVISDPYYGDIEVRQSDNNWGRGQNTSNWIGLYSWPGFTLTRQQYEQEWYMRPVQYGASGIAIGVPGGTITSRRSKVLRVYYPMQPTPPAFQGQSPGAPNVVQYDYTGDMRNIYGFELRAQDNETILFQQPATSFATLLIDLSQTPLSLPSNFPGEVTLYAYFFNQMWGYSEPNVVTITVAGERIPYPWSPAWTVPIPGDAYYTAASFGVQPAYALDRNGNQLATIAIKGVTPVSQLSGLIGEPSVMAASGTGGSLPAGNYAVGVFAYDDNTVPEVSPLGEATTGTLLDDIVVSQSLIAVPANGAISGAITWGPGQTSGTICLSNVDIDGPWWQQQTVAASGPITDFALTTINQTTAGAPDDDFNNYVAAMIVEEHGGSWGEQVDAVGFNTLAFSGILFSPGQFNGGVISLVGKYDQTVDIPVANLLVSNTTVVTTGAASGSILTIGANMLGIQPPDLRTFCASGDVMVMRYMPTITPQGFSDQNIVNAYETIGNIPEEEVGRLVWVLADPLNPAAAGQPPIPIASGTQTSYTLAAPWNPMPSSGACIVVTDPQYDVPYSSPQQTLSHVNAVSGTVMIPNVDNLAGQVWLCQVLMEDAEVGSNSVRAPIREVYIFGKGQNFTSVTGDYTQQLSDQNLMVNSMAGDIVLTLLPRAAWTVPQLLIKKISSDANDVNVMAVEGENIDFEAGWVLSKQNDYLLLKANSTTG